MGWSHVFSSVSQSDVRKAAPAQVCRNIRFRRHCFGLCAAASWFLGKLSTQIAVSDATDIVTKAVNDSINEVIGQGYTGLTTL